MPEAEANGVRLYFELHGSGEPLALVHGAWADATAWRFVVPGVAENLRVLSYDPRGHSRSERPATQGSFDEDGDDLVALLEGLDLAPAQVVTNSGGGSIALRLATRRPDLFRSLSCHAQCDSTRQSDSGRSAFAAPAPPPALPPAQKGSDDACLAGPRDIAT